MPLVDVCFAACPLDWLSIGWSGDVSFWECAKVRVMTVMGRVVVVAVSPFPCNSTPSYGDL